MQRCVNKNDGVNVATVPEFLASGERVYITRQSHLHEQAKAYLSQALACVDSEGAAFLRVEVIFPHKIGLNELVSVSPGDDLYMGQRENRRNRELFVRNRRPEPSNTQIVVLRRADEPQSYFLQTSFVGAERNTPVWRAFTLHEPKLVGQQAVTKMAEPSTGDSNQREVSMNEKEVERLQKKATFDRNYPESLRLLLEEYPGARPMRGPTPPYRKGKQVKKVIQAKTARQLLSDHHQTIRYEHRFYDGGEAKGVGAVWLSIGYLGDALGGCGYGRSKKIADEAAARSVLELFGMPYPKVLEIRS